jgi:hypothetical protein
MTAFLSFHEWMRWFATLLFDDDGVVLKPECIEKGEPEESWTGWREGDLGRFAVCRDDEMGWQLYGSDFKEENCYGTDDIPTTVVLWATTCSFFSACFGRSAREGGKQRMVNVCR